jgi:glycosyltransferase involved in cell wall biosynthesis
VSRRRRALVVAYDFPPHAAIGTMRTLRLVQRLVEDDWEVRVLTSDPRTFRSGTPADNSLLARVPSSVTVLRAPVVRGLDALKGLVRRASQPGSTALPRTGASSVGERRRGFSSRVSDFLDAALAIPDHESGWIVPAVAKGFRTGRSWRPDVLYSSAPPWTGQIVAHALADLLGCPWVADFRDPWARAPWREARREFVRRANGVLEQRVIRRADAVLFVTRGNLDEFSTHYGLPASGRFHIVPNGCDPSEFSAISASPRTDRFVLLHAGTLYGARNPLPLIHAIARAVDRGAIVRTAFCLRLVGPINLSVDLAAESRRLGLEGVVEIVPRVTRAESLREMVSASALLLVQPGTTVSVPGKAYEYLAAARPVLALAAEGETAELVRASGLGVSVRPEAGVEAIEAALLELMGIAASSYQPPPSELYDGRVHAATAAEILRRMATRERPAGPVEARASDEARRASVQLEESRR